MASLSENNDQIILNRRDMQILTALLLAPMNGNQIASQCQQDENKDTPMSNGSLWPSLTTLKELSLIDFHLHGYQITSLGKDVLAIEGARLRRLADHIKDRSPC